MSSNTPTPSDVTVARKILAEWDALNARDGWEGLSHLERSIWTGRLAEALRFALDAYDAAGGAS